jgi:hypothetical protein
MAEKGLPSGGPFLFYRSAVSANEILNNYDSITIFKIKSTLGKYNTNRRLLHEKKNFTTTV